MTSTPTDIQKKKFEKFSKHPLKDKAVEFLNYVIAVADLDIEDLCITWGVTLCADSKSVLRVNVSNRYLADIFVSKSYPDGRALMCLIGEPQVIGPQSMRIHDGFENIENSVIITCDLGTDSSRLISEQTVQSALKAHANTSVRKLPNANWHNPLSVSLMSQDKDDQLQILVKKDLNPIEDANTQIIKHVAMMLFIFFTIEGLNQEEEDLFIDELNEAAKQLCESMSLSVTEVHENNKFITSLNLINLTSESANLVTPEDNMTSIEIAGIKIIEHMAMMLFVQFVEPDANKEEKDNFVDDVNEMAEILYASMNFEVIELRESGAFFASIQLEDVEEFFENLTDELDNN